MPLILLVSMAYWSEAESSRRRSSRMRVAWERLRARRKFGTAMDVSNAMIATTIMISTKVKPRVLWMRFNMDLFMVMVFVMIKIEFHKKQVMNQSGFCAAVLICSRKHYTIYSVFRLILDHPVRHRIIPEWRGAGFTRHF